METTRQVRWPEYSASSEYLHCLSSGFNDSAVCPDTKSVSTATILDNQVATDPARLFQRIFLRLLKSYFDSDRRLNKFHEQAIVKCLIKCRLNRNIPPVPTFTSRPKTEMNAVDLLLLNARLRDEIEPFIDESIIMLDSRQLSIEDENEFLASMLDWERAPVLPIGRWFEPELRLPSPDSLNESQLFATLHKTIATLFEKHIVLEYTDHLSDRELYCLILRDILPAQEKRLASQSSFLRWQCVDGDCDSEVWLAFYATDLQRQIWQQENGTELPKKRTPPHGRRLPIAPGQCS